MSQPLITIGPYIVGEIPAPLEYQFLDSADNPIDLTGYTANFQWGERGFKSSFINSITENATITDDINGKVTYTWDGDEFRSSGRYVGMFWVGNLANRFASILIIWNTCQSVDNPPQI